MTGFATKILQLSSITLQLEIRSVNHRFFDLIIKTPDEFKPLESNIRDKIVSLISRGKVDLRITIKENEHANLNLKLNQDILHNYITMYKQIKNEIPTLNDSSVTDIINLPGVVSHDSIRLNEINTILLNEVDLLGKELLVSMETEGRNLAEILINKINQIDNIVTNSLNILPEIYANHKSKLKQKLCEAFEESMVNEQRFAQEFAYFCQKSDVDEELSRLKSHTTQFLQLLQNGGAVGKKIDFLTQEMLREANTFGAKSISILLTQNAVNLKVLIEQIKEQLQNIA